MWAPQTLSFVLSLLCSVAGACNKADDSCGEDRWCRPQMDTDQEDGQCVPYRGQNQSCGGYTLPSAQERCGPDYECIYTSGPFIADAPGLCLPPCSDPGLDDGGIQRQGRDDWGHCIPHGCKVWFDGCNTCYADGSCTEMACFDSVDSPACLDDTTPCPITDCAIGYSPSVVNSGDCTCVKDHLCPANCATFFDGCNTCQCEMEGDDGICSRRSCAALSTPRCEDPNDFDDIHNCCLAMIASCLACGSNESIDEYCSHDYVAGCDGWVDDISMGARSTTLMLTAVGLCVTLLAHPSLLLR